MRMHPREGFALPVAIFVIGFLTVGVAAAISAAGGPGCPLARGTNGPMR